MPKHFKYVQNNILSSVLHAETLLEFTRRCDWKVITMLSCVFVNIILTTADHVTKIDDVLPPQKKKKKKKVKLNVLSGKFGHICGATSLIFH